MLRLREIIAAGTIGEVRSVTADHRHGDPGPVADVPTCGREHVNRGGVGALGHRRQIADHSTRAAGQGQLDRAVEVVDQITQQARDLKDNHLTFSAPGYPYLRANGLTTVRSHRRLARVGRRVPGRAQDHVVVEICGKTSGVARDGDDGELDSVVPE